MRRVFSLFHLFLFFTILCPLSPFTLVSRFMSDTNYLLLNRAILTKPLRFLFNDTRAVPFSTLRNVCMCGALLFNEYTSRYILLIENLD